MSTVYEYSIGMFVTRVREVHFPIGAILGRQPEVESNGSFEDREHCPLE
jgi:hypothetical protein